MCRLISTQSMVEQSTMAIDEPLVCSALDLRFWAHRALATWASSRSTVRTAVELDLFTFLEEFTLTYRYLLMESRKCEPLRACEKQHAKTLYLLDTTLRNNEYAYAMRLVRFGTAATSFRSRASL